MDTGARLDCRVLARVQHSTFTLEHQITRFRLHTAGHIFFFAPSLSSNLSSSQSLRSLGQSRNDPLCCLDTNRDLPINKSSLPSKISCEPCRCTCAYVYGLPCTVRVPIISSQDLSQQTSVIRISLKSTRSSTITAHLFHSPFCNCSFLFLLIRAAADDPQLTDSKTLRIQTVTPRRPHPDPELRYVNPANRQPKTYRPSKGSMRCGRGAGCT